MNPPSKSSPHEAAASGYKVLDSGELYKLEQVGQFRLVRPSPQSVWRRSLSPKEWDCYDAKFTRDVGGLGKWSVRNQAIRTGWLLKHRGLKFFLNLTDFGHLGIFPEHLEKFDELQSRLKRLTKPKILNLFAYTGAATLACAMAGAEVVHVDSSKTSVAWAKKNADLNAIGDTPIRWIVDDVRKYVQREQKRGVRYEGIILDPPSFGRGGKGEVWKIERDLCDLLEGLSEILATDFAFLLLTSHSSGYSPTALSNLLAPYAKQDLISCGEMLIAEAGGRSLPSGAFALMNGIQV